MKLKSCRRFMGSVHIPHAKAFFFFLSSYLYINRSETQINGCVQIIKDCKRGHVKGHFPWVVESQYGT